MGMRSPNAISAVSMARRRSEQKTASIRTPRRRSPSYFASSRPLPESGGLLQPDATLASLSVLVEWNSKMISTVMRGVINAFCMTERGGHRGPPPTEDGCSVCPLFAAVVLEGELHLRAVGDDRAFLELHVQLDDLGDAEVTQAGGGHLDGGRGGCFPGLAARANEFDDLVDALGHWGLLLLCGWIRR